MSRKRIIFTDIDGTLITSDRKITQRTLRAIQEWIDRGNLFVLSSSRSAPGIEPIMRDYDLKCSVSAIAGALLLDENRNVIYENGFSVETAEKVIRYIEEKDYDLTWNVFTKDRWIVADRTDPRVIEEEGIVRTQSEEGSVDDISVEEPVEKILCMCAPGTIMEIETDLKTAFPNLSISKSSDVLLEVNNTGVSKAAAIEKICAYYGVDIRDTIAFGDNYNDLAMLKSAGIGVAMGNAPDDVKAAADRVTEDNDHDGLAIVVEELLV